jgi:TetR/AcrR family transcriptional regulator
MSSSRPRRANSRSPKPPRLKTADAASSARHATRDPVRTRGRILDIASEEFASRGFDGTRVDEIAARSMVSKNLIYHYFESKDALFIAVLERAHEIFRTHQENIQLNESKPLQNMRNLVVESFRYWSQSRQFIAYLDSANFHKSKHVKKSVPIQNAYSSLIERMSNILHQGVEEKVFRHGVDPLDLYISISALAYHFFQFQHMYSIIFRKELNSDSVIAARLRHVEDMILGYLQFRPVP